MQTSRLAISATWRQVKNLITWILRSWRAQRIQRLNYVKEYICIHNTVQKTEQKIVIIYHNDKDQLFNFINKKFVHIQRNHIWTYGIIDKVE